LESTGELYDIIEFSVEGNLGTSLENQVTSKIKKDGVRITIAIIENPQNSRLGEKLLEVKQNQILFVGISLGKFKYFLLSMLKYQR